MLHTDNDDIHNVATLEVLGTEVIPRELTQTYRGDALVSLNFCAAVRPSSPQSYLTQLSGLRTLDLSSVPLYRAVLAKSSDG